MWFFGAVAAASVAGDSRDDREPDVAHRFRRDEPLFVVALAVAGVVSVFAAITAARASAEVAAVFAVALGANIARQSFDSVLQRDAPDAARGRAFARFETLFQLVWVVGALLAVVLQPSLDRGLVALAAAFVLTAVGYGAYLAACRAPGGRRHAMSSARSLSILASRFAASALGSFLSARTAFSIASNRCCSVAAQGRLLVERTQARGAPVCRHRLTGVVETEQRRDLAERTALLTERKRLLVVGGGGVFHESLLGHRRRVDVRTALLRARRLHRSSTARRPPRAGVR